jgi:hypothetical protein
LGKERQDGRRCGDNKAWWLKATEDKFASILGMHTWSLVPWPQKQKITKSKWVFKVKHRPDHSIQKLKACLVARGYSQVKGLDYQEVFSLTLHLILSLLSS